MQTKFTVRQIHVFPKKGDLVNIVGKVDWTVTFTRNGATSSGAGDTLLDTDNVKYFIPIEEVTEQLAIQWVLEKEGGDNFIENLKRMHEQNLQYQEKMIGLVPWEFADKETAIESPKPVAE